MDSSAQSAAQRRGRAYPPIPTHLTNLAPSFLLNQHPHKDMVSSPGGPDSGPYITYHFSDAEHSYWGWFWRTQPKPPLTLEREQFNVAETVLRFRKPLLVGGVDMHTETPASRRQRSAVYKSRAAESGVPMEALTDDALFWAYVLRQRQQYEKEQAQAASWKPQRPDIADKVLGRFLDQMLVDTKLITEPLTDDQLQAANAWKVAYLQRLRREKTDESYIKAYLAAWNLDRGQVFPEETRK